MDSAGDFQFGVSEVEGELCGRANLLLSWRDPPQLVDCLGQAPILFREHRTNPVGPGVAEADLDQRSDNIPDHMVQECISLAFNFNPFPRATDIEPPEIPDRALRLARRRTK